MDELKCLLESYYPKDETFTEISVRYYGKIKTIDFLRYLKLKCIVTKLELNYPDFVIKDNSLVFGNYFIFECRSILNNNQDKTSKIKTILKEVISSKNSMI